MKNCKLLNSFFFFLSFYAWHLPNVKAQIWDTLHVNATQTQQLSIANLNGNLFIYSSNYKFNVGPIYEDLIIYDGNSYHGIGKTIGIINGPISSLYSYNGKTLMYGYHGGIGGCGINCAYISDYNNGSWQPYLLNNNNISDVNDIIAYDGKLFVGCFDMPNTFGLSYVTSSGNIITIPDSLNTGIIALEVYKDTLFIGGSFDSTNHHSPADYVGFLDKTDYRVKPFGDFNSTVFDIKTYKNELYATGWFNKADNDSAYGIAKFDTISRKWKRVGMKGVNNPTGAFCATTGAMMEYDYKLFISGGYCRIDTLDNYRGLVAWDGTKYIGYGKADWQYISSMCIFQNKLTVAGMDTSGFHFIAQLIYDPYSTGIKVETKNYDWNVNIFPNPTSDVITLACSSPEKVMYHIYNISGQLIQQGYFTQITTLNTSGFAKGTYKVVVKNKAEIICKSLVVQ